MNDDKLFFGRTEKRLYAELKEKKFLTLEYIYGNYSGALMGRGFINKLLTFQIAKLSKPGVIEYVPKEARR